MKRLGWAIGAAFLTAGAAAAQHGAGEPDNAPIVVEGQRDSESQIRELVQSLPPASANGHLSRFERAACPAVIGLAPRQRALATARMRAVATAAGARIGRPDCRANLLVIVTPDKKQLIEQLAAHYPFYFGDLPPRKVAALAKAPGPAVLWNLEALVDADGRELFAAGTQNVAARRTTRTSSRITDLAHPAIAGSILVVETRALDGLTTTQLADYAAMRSLTGADPARFAGGEGSTILTILDAPMGSEVPVTLTPRDLAFIKSYYAMDTNRYAPGQRGEIKARMKKELEAADDGTGGR